MKRILPLSILLFAMLTLLWACGAGGPRDVAEHFLDATSHGDYAKAKEYASKSSAKSLDMLAGIPNEKSAHPDKIEYVDMNVIDDRATYSYKENDSLKNLSLIKEDGKWKVAWSKN